LAAHMARKDLRAQNKRQKYIAYYQSRVKDGSVILPSSEDVPYAVQCKLYESRIATSLQEMDIEAVLCPAPAEPYTQCVEMDIVPEKDFGLESFSTLWCKIMNANPTAYGNIRTLVYHIEPNKHVWLFYRLLPISPRVLEIAPETKTPSKTLEEREAERDAEMRELRRRERLAWKGYSKTTPFVNQAARWEAKAVEEWARRGIQAVVDPMPENGWYSNEKLSIGHGPEFELEPFSRVWDRIRDPISLLNTHDRTGNKIVFHVRPGQKVLLYYSFPDAD